MIDPKTFIQKYSMLPHPEGGYFKEVYRADEKIKELPGRYDGERFFSTSIYFLLIGENKSNLHRLKSDEIWHFYEGSPIKLYIIEEDGSLTIKKVGRNIDEGEEFQVVINKGTWFCAEIIDKSSFSLIGCTVAPGFEFSDFELWGREKLLSEFPAHKDLIIRFSVE
jgi:uncharacterized protein